MCTNLLYPSLSLSLSLCVCVKNNKNNKNKTGELDVLYISPERLYDASFLSRLASLPKDRIAFACVDEAHCISQWSHNFRPSYLRLDIVLRQQLGVRCILGLTATATAQTEASVRSKLCIPRQVCTHIL